MHGRWTWIIVGWRKVPVECSVSNNRGRHRRDGERRSARPGSQPVRVIIGSEARSCSLRRFFIRRRPLEREIKTGRPAHVSPDTITVAARPQWMRVQLRPLQVSARATESAIIRTINYCRLAYLVSSDRQTKSLQSHHVRFFSVDLASCRDIQLCPGRVETY